MVSKDKIPTLRSFCAGNKKMQCGLTRLFKLQSGFGKCNRNLVRVERATDVRKWLGNKLE